MTSQTILVVDDDEDLRSVAAYMLQSLAIRCSRRATR